MTDTRSWSVAFAALALSASVASAAPGRAITDVNIRQGPGTNFPVVTLIRAGSNLDVGRCRAFWCPVRFDQYAGFVKATYIDFGFPRRARPYYRPSSSPFLYGPPPPRYWGPGPYWGPRPYYYGYGWRRPYWGW